MVTLQVELPEIGEVFLSFVYADCDRRIRQVVWNQIENMARGVVGKGLWAVLGDFNCILKGEEKQGGLPYQIAKNREFQHSVDNASLREVSYYGNPFTWWNGIEGSQAIWKRLDRALVSEKWEGSLKTYVQHLSKVTSDHAPLVMDLETQVFSSRRPFTFINAWTEHEQFLTIVQQTWEGRVEGNAMYRFVSKLKRVKSALIEWNWTVFGNIFDKVKELEEKVRVVEDALQNNPTQENLMEYKLAQAKLQKQVVIEEKFWQQKAHVQWVVDGERNTKYFQGLVREKRRKQIIHRIKNEEGVWVDDQEQIRELDVRFFEKLYTAKAVSSDQSVLNCLQVLVTPEENQRLIGAPSEEEIKSCVFSLGANSAPGPDGFGGGFYQSCWDIIKEDLIVMVISFFEGKSLTKAITSTSIVLIPKTPNPSSFSDFRPISLSNFCSKVITKVMVVRLADILTRIISPNQAGFMKGRSIIDNVLLAQEICHGMKTYSEDIILKLDMTKAYDRLDWGCISSVLKGVGFL
ncbi:PREDICTED: uncharacterized protein LOC109147876 [Ipomoea nil]|uniref:uncharacterized protein LOC109147876 n=1 Tax=Ipomoea nil TaxID=35883 RepID=UPI000901EAEC|nr:PREDICTED: uncharacterized protein LOC109147876 [Ipomoea nil]